MTRRIARCWAHKAVMVGAVVGALSALGNNNAHASINPIDLGLYNTGVDDSGNLLSAGNLDTHYTLISAPAPVALPDVNTTSPASPNWLANGPNSNWITPAAFANAGNSTFPNQPANWPNTAPVGDYKYELTFSSPGPYLSLVGQWGSDNPGELYLNGSATPVSTSASFSSLSPIVINSGVVAGANTLTFVVHNISGSGANPTGLRVEFLSAAVPEPASVVVWSLLSLSVGGMAWRHRRPPAARRCRAG